MRLAALGLALAGVTTALQSLPPVKWHSADGKGFSISSSPKKIFIDGKFADRKDEGGLTTIPPSAFEFAEIFVNDVNELTGDEWTLERVKSIPKDGKGIYLGEFRGKAENMTYENGEETEEAYELEVKDGSVYIGGTGARGMWWGTRTLLQHIVLTGDDELSAGHVNDAPAFSTRGFLLDCGRKWYSPEFLKDMCTFASFFKMSEFQYHLMDNYPLNRGRNDTWQEVYHQFALMPEDPELNGLIRMENETLSREDFTDLQQHCASRGITIIPEIEAPGHALAITKWKEELALSNKHDLLNLSHPDATKTVKKMWAEFLPWFETKEVHVGADEYDPELADDYITFVNEMEEFVRTTSKKEIRIWGTHEPSDNLTINKDVIIQHWQYGQSDPVEQEPEGYRVVNSEDWVSYTGMKNDHMPILPARYPQWFNMSRVLNFADKEGWQWDPNMFDPYNTTEQLQAGSKGNKGAIFAMWNDNGVDASTQLEAFYTMREGFPAFGSRAWSGERGVLLDAATIHDSAEVMSLKAPGQNLHRRLPSELGTNATKSNNLYSWERSDGDSKDGSISLGQGSKGMNYSLTIEATGPFTLKSNDSELSLDKDGNLVFSSDNWPYPLRHVDEKDGFDAGHPGRIWTNVSSSTHEAVTIPLKSTIKITTTFLEGSRVTVNDKFVGRFEVFIFGGKNTLFSWSQMAFAAPLQELKGSVDKISVSRYPSGKDGEDGGDGGDGGDGDEPPQNENAAMSIRGTPGLAILATVCALGHFLLA